MKKLFAVLVLANLFWVGCQQRNVPDNVPIANTVTATQVSSPTVVPSPTPTSSPTTLSPTRPVSITVSPTPLPRSTRINKDTGQAPNGVTCADLDRAWGAGNWDAALKVLSALRAKRAVCGPEPLLTKEYAVHINYAVALEAQKKFYPAMLQYRAALTLNAQGKEALRALLRLGALPAATPAPCAPAFLPPYVAAEATQSFARIKDGNISLDGAPYYVRGVNYYPRHAPWEAFLKTGDLSEMEQELDMIAARGLNTVRIFLWYEALFECAPERAVPNAAVFYKLDELIHLAHARDLKLIITLNDLPDFYFQPIYTDWARYDAQTAFIVRRYRDEPTILAWDLRNEGDIDYGITGNAAPNTTRENVLAWLAHTSTLVRANDPNHLLTAGWLSDSLATAPYVDFLSFHYWAERAGLVQRIRYLKERTKKPILVEEIGQSSVGAQGEESQAERLPGLLRTVDEYRTAGWLLWTAFDFPPIHGQEGNDELAFGLWRNDLTPKPVLDLLPVNLPVGLAQTQR